MRKPVTLGVVVGLVLLGCLPDDSSGPPCSVDADCTHLDTDSDECTVVSCESSRCVPRVLTSSPQCQCATDDDCAAMLGGTVKDCATATCTEHQCVEKIEPAGPAPRQTAGDCARVTCDGTSAAGKMVTDDTDLPDDQNACTVDECFAGAPSHATSADGATCGDGSVCFAGACLSCKPSNAKSCAKDGPGEPANDKGTSAIAYPEHTSVCGFSGGDDVDWYTFFAKDADFATNVLRFQFWSSAPTLEACLYVKCENNGVPEGGCANLADGPNGSRGCCYTGAPADVKPSWDLDCTGSSEDSGTVYLSVRTIGGTTCDRYTLTGGY
ncbi:MAG: hypothetical protein U0270_04680 [Labilithrix sp.]